MSDELRKKKALNEQQDGAVGAIRRSGDPVVKPMTEEEAQAAVNATLDSADEADLREISNSEGDLHSPGSSETNAELNKAAAMTADELAVKQAEDELEAKLEAELDAAMDKVLSSPEIVAMLDAAVEDAAQDVDETTPEGRGLIAESMARRVLALEQKVAAFETILNEFKVRALAAFKHAGFKF